MGLQSVTCASCGAPIKISDNVDYLNCIYCGTYQTIERGEGYVTLKVVEQVSQSIRDVGEQIQSELTHGTQITQDGLRRLQLNQELASAQTQLVSIQSEIREINRQKKQNSTSRKQVNELRIQEKTLTAQINQLQKTLNPQQIKSEDRITGKKSSNSTSKNAIIIILGSIFLFSCFCAFIMIILANPSTSKETTTITELVIPETSSTITKTPSLLTTPAPTIKMNLILGQDTYFRTGPGTNYRSALWVKKGESYSIIGKNKVGDWLLIDAEKPLWVRSVIATINVPIENIPLAPMMTPIPTQALIPTQTIRYTNIPTVTKLSVSTSSRGSEIFATIW